MFVQIAHIGMDREIWMGFLGEWKLNAVLTRPENVQIEMAFTIAI